jgi:tetratricopeptide (TPR) repeat protein
MLDPSRAPALRRRVALGFSTTLLGLLTACSAVPAPVAPVAPGVPAATGTARPIEVAPMVVSPFSDSELEARFEKARALLLAEKYKEAAPAFDALVRLAPDGEVAPPSLYNGALAHEALGEREAAIERYNGLLQRFPRHATARGALFRLSRLDAFLERWSDLTAVSDRILALADLTVIEAIEAHGQKALGLIEQDKLEDASHQVSIARDMIEEHRIGDAGAPPIELATVSFALGEVRRKKSEKIALVPVTPNFAEVLEQRCQALLDAQNAYTDAMRSFDAHWSAMAGYRVGQLYQTLHHDVMAIPPTAKADTLKKKQLFEGAMRLRYRVLLEKGLKMMEGTVRIGQRTGEDSAWIHRADEAKRDIERALEDEKTALSKLPFTEAELTEALEKLKKPVP